MGNKCTTCDDVKQTEYNTEIYINKKTLKSPLRKSFLELNKENISPSITGNLKKSMICKSPTQSFKNNDLAKKSMILNSQSIQSPKLSVRSSFQQFGKKLEKMPNYLNENTKEVLMKLGNFQYDEEDEFIDFDWKGPIEIDTAVYYGQWKNTERFGRGLQIWTDGSQFEGYWKNDMANGKGRLIHNDGDVYIGNWLDDKAHGQGVYLHKDGAYYEGMFF